MSSSSKQTGIVVSQDLIDRLSKLDNVNKTKTDRVPVDVRNAIFWFKPLKGIRRVAAELKVSHHAVRTIYYKMLEDSGKTDIEHTAEAKELYGPQD